MRQSPSVAGEKLDVRAALRENEIVRERLVVVEEVLLDHVALVAEADDEIVVPEVRVVLHDVEQDRPVGDRHHRLGDARRGLLHAQSETTAEEDDLHGSLKIVAKSLDVIEGVPFDRERCLIRLRPNR